MEFSSSNCRCVGCGSQTSLFCPDCKKLGYPADLGAFCSKDCFKKNWKSHKKIHNSIISFASGGQADKTSVPAIATGDNKKAVSDKTRNEAIDYATANNGVEVGLQEGMGRVLLAKRAFSVGETVLVEKPLVIFGSGNYFGLVREYLKLSVVDRTKFLDMKHCSDTRSDVTHEPCRRKLESLMPDAVRCASIQCDGQSISAREAFQVITASYFNCHSFTGKSEAFSENFVPVTESKKAALFSMASKVAHSCAPNCGYSSRAVEGHLIYVAIEPIAAGDVITFSYLDVDWHTARRRASLLESKDFYCECSRCVGPDYNSGIRCNRAGCRGTTLMTATRTETVWQCSSCSNGDAPSSLAAESTARGLAYFATSMCNAQAVSPGLLDKMEVFIREAVEKLSPTHFLVTALLVDLSTYYASAAARIEGRTGTPACQMRFMSADAGLRAAKTVECAAANCSVGVGCLKNHPAVSGNGSVWTLWACLDLIKCGKSIPESLRKYQLIWEISYGRTDTDVVNILQHIL